jgi:hypothetical protein
MYSQRTGPPTSSLIGLLLIAAVAIVAASRVWTGTPVTAADTADASATATRQAELTEVAALRTEVAALRTQVAALKQATPTPTSSPTPTATPVPPKAMNEPVPYVDAWTITVADVSKAPTVTGGNETKTAQGVYVVVRLTATNDGREGRRFPFQEFILVDERGRVFDPTTYESILVSDNWQSLPPSIPTDTAIVFDVTTDVGNSFILESRTDPTFRVALEVVLRG